MNHMTIDSSDAPWNDTREWEKCDHCKGEGYHYKTNGIKKCASCDGYGEVFK
jgi:DnaJ-class molecular chaperone